MDQNVIVYIPQKYFRVFFDELDDFGFGDIGQGHQLKSIKDTEFTFQFWWLSVKEKSDRIKLLYEKSGWLGNISFSRCFLQGHKNRCPKDNQDLHGQWRLLH